MFITLIRYCSLLICSFFIYLKVLHISPKKKIYFSFVLFLTLILPVIYFLKVQIPSLILLVLVVLFALCLTIILKTQLNLSLITSVISFGIAYFIYLVASAFMSAIGYLIYLFKKEYPPFLFIMVCICGIQFLLTFMLFLIKRFKSGIPSLRDHGSNDNGAYLSILLLLAASLLNLSETEDIIFIIPVSFSILCGLSLFFWWKSSINKKYLEKIKTREMEELQKIIQESNHQIEQLRHHNDELSKIIHKDNKLIPAMEYAVREYLTVAEHAPSTSIALAKGQELLDQLADLTKERTGILANYESHNKRLPSTDIASIDTLLAYMSKKAQEYGINFDVTLSGSLTPLSKQPLDEADLRTLLADLLENAIIATKKASSRNILINLGFSNGWYSIDIFDSGAHFRAETLSNIGLKRTTTHVKEGGSGIGLMTVFELIKKCQASFIIEELSDSHLFTKKVSVFFDQLGEFRIKTSKDVIKRPISPYTSVIQNSSRKNVCSQIQGNSLYTTVEHS